MDRFLWLVSDAAGALALLAFVSAGSYLAVRYARRRFPTAAERRLLDQQDAILDALTNIEERLQILEHGDSPRIDRRDATAPRRDLPERTPTPV